MQWLKVILSGLIEVVWVTCLNYAHNTFTWLITLLFIALSFYLMLSATKQLPVGTVYAVFVGIGAAGTAVSYTHLTLPTIAAECRSRWSPYH